MTLTSAIISRAYRESNVTALGAQPNAAQQVEGLETLASMIAGVYGFDVGEKLQDWLVGTVGIHRPRPGWNELLWKYPRENSRIILAQSTAQTLYLPNRVDNGARIHIVDQNGALAAHPVTLDGNGRLIGGASSVVLNTNNLNRTWVFNSDTSNWVVIEGLELTDEMPFPTQFDDYFIIKLAGRLNPRYGRSLSDLSLGRLAEVEENLISTYRQTRSMPAPTAVRLLDTPNRAGREIYGRRGRWGWM